MLARAYINGDNFAIYIVADDIFVLDYRVSEILNSGRSFGTLHNNLAI